MAAKSVGGENGFLRKVASRLYRNPGGLKFRLSHSVTERNAFLSLTQKFKMAAKSGGKMIFAKSRQYTLVIPCGSKTSKSLYPTPLLR